MLLSLFLLTASLIPSEVPREAPTRTFDHNIHHDIGVNAVAPWALQGAAGTGDKAVGSVMPPTKAPWAK